MNLGAPRTRLVGPAAYVRELLAGGPSPAVPLPLSREAAPGGSPRVRHMAEAIKLDAMRWLCGYEGGGWRSLQVVVSGRRREGRLWEKAIARHLGLRFSDAPLALAAAAMQTRWSPPALPDEVTAKIRARWAEDDLPTGDLIALHRLVVALTQRSAQADVAACLSCSAPARSEDLARKKPTCANCGASLAKIERGPPSPRRDRQEALLALSPLTLLFRPEAAGSLSEERYGPLTELLAPLFRGDRAALLSYLAPSLARAWIAEERRRRASPAASAQEGYRAAARGMTAYVSAARDRPDALRPLISFYASFVSSFGGRAPVVEGLLHQAKVFDRVSTRDAFLRDAASVLSFGASIQRCVDDALGTAFVDRSEPEKVLLSEYHESFRGSVAAEIEATRRELMREVG